jgi:hypothetical protein
VWHKRHSRLDKMDKQGSLLTTGASWFMGALE